MLFRSGRKYEGKFKNGKRHGKGREDWPNGSYKEGQWKNDAFHSGNASMTSHI